MTPIERTSGRTTPFAIVDATWRAEDEEGDEVEEGGPRDGEAGRQHPSRNDGGDRVGGVVEAVDEVEGQRQPDDDDDGGELHGRCDVRGEVRRA